MYATDPPLRRQFATRLLDMPKIVVFLWKTLEEIVEDTNSIIEIYFYFYLNLE